jgi:hypothetical protein
LGKGLGNPFPIPRFGVKNGNYLFI